MARKKVRIAHPYRLPVILLPGYAFLGPAGQRSVSLMVKRRNLHKIE
jgi:hypothetical protein